jgi:SAM-dependent methyltransferase
MDAYQSAIPVERAPSSARAFGEWSLEPPDGRDAVPRDIFFADPEPRPEHRRLLRDAYRRLLADRPARVLDLLAGAESYLDPAVPFTVVGLAGTLGELRDNPALAERVVHDVNEDPRLPFADGGFDAVLLTLGAGRLRLPLEVFRDIHRVLAPSGTVAMTFLHPALDRRFTRMWAFGDDRDHVVLAESFVSFAGRGFARPTTVCLYDGPDGPGFVHGGLPPEDRSATRVHLVWSTKGPPPPERLERPPFPAPVANEPLSDEVRPDAAGRPACIWCGAAMKRYAPPTTVFEIDYGVPELYVCFSDGCPYYRRSKHWMRVQGHPGYTYRFMWNPHSGASGPIPDNLAGGLASGRLE